MSLVTIDTSSLTTIADAIRTKESSSSSIPFVNFASKILNLPSGISGAHSGSFTVGSSTSVDISHGYSAIPGIIFVFAEAEHFNRSTIFSALYTDYGTYDGSTQSSVKFNFMGITFHNSDAMLIYKDKKAITATDTQFTISQYRDGFRYYVLDNTYTYHWIAIPKGSVSQVLSSVFLEHSELLTTEMLNEISSQKLMFDTSSKVGDVSERL